MMNNFVEHQVAGERLLLLPERAVYWPAERAMLLSDTHFGKASSWRHAGVPVPHGTMPTDLDRLSRLLSASGAEKLMVLGDFFHHHTGQCERTMTLLSEWRAAHSEIKIEIIAGNHDRHSLPPPPQWNVQLHNTPQKAGPFLLCHEPCQHAELYVISGHIHPAIRLKDYTGGLTLPCFYFAQDHAILPAFGSFTGTASMTFTDDNTVFVIAENEIIPVRT